MTTLFKSSNGTNGVKRKVRWSCQIIYVLLYLLILSPLFTISIIMIHTKCRNAIYPFSKITRLTVTDSFVPWSKEWPDYNPPVYTSNAILNKPWADPDISDPNFKPKWNELDGSINRISYTTKYIIKNGYPLNPIGRTGLQGRGVLGRWGPNHAADPIVTRWKRDSNGAIITNTNSLKPILQFCAIQRRDNNEWAIPGGMVDANEKVTQTLLREFQEETLNILEVTQKRKEELNEMVSKFFKQGIPVYQGYVDDPRNTDNAWMETVAYNFHDETGTSVGQFPLNAGDDAKNVQWMDISKNLNLYASHLDFIKLVAERHSSDW